MTIKTFPKSPYFNDYNEKSNFVQILFRPELAVQTREMNSMQTMMQTQIAHLSNHILKNNTVIKDGELTIDNQVFCVRINDDAENGNNLANILPKLVGLQVVNEDTKTYAQIVFYQLKNQNNNDYNEIFIKYLGSVDSSQNHINYFKANDVLQINNTTDTKFNNIRLIVKNIENAQTGASIAFIKEGVFYINGFYVFNNDQKYIVSDTTNKPSCRVGLKIIEETVTPENDESLLDNASGAPNYNAVGAHRYKLDLHLTSREFDESDEMFVEIARMEDGEIVSQKDKTEYGDFLKTLARRTYDTNGDFTVMPFIADVREHRTNNRGEWKPNTKYLIDDCILSNGLFFKATNSGTSGLYSAPTASNLVDNNINWKRIEKVQYNNGIFYDGDENAIAFGLEAGKAYVRGYEIETKSVNYQKLIKPSNTNFIDNAVINVNIGNYVICQSVRGTFEPFTQIDIFSDFNTQAKVGTAIGLNVEIANDGYRLYLMDVKLFDGISFSTNVLSFGIGNYFHAVVKPNLLNIPGNYTCNNGNISGTSISFIINCKVNEFLLINNIYTRILEIVDDYHIRVDRNDINGVFSIQKVTTQLKETLNNKLFFEFPEPYKYAKTLRAPGSSVTDISYSVVQKLTGRVSNNIATITSTNGVFNNKTFVITDQNGNIITYLVNVHINLNVLTITLPNSNYNNQQIYVQASVLRNGQSLPEKKKTKIATSATFNLNNEFTYLRLNKTDIISVNKVYINDILIDPQTYIVNNGQTNYYYDFGSITFKSLQKRGKVVVEFEYFEHSAGDYFSVDSYPSMKDIPYFNDVRLNDVIDFRPDVVGESNGVKVFNSPTFPPNGENIIVDIYHYLARSFIICLNSSGEFMALTGNDDRLVNLKYPDTPANTMRLYEGYMNPIVEDVKRDVFVKMIDNKRYTMRDIGKLENRIENLEYYTSLSLLENSVSNMNIVDSEGNSRFKNGFIVDDFKSKIIGDIYNIFYRCSIDTTNGIMRPPYTVNNIEFIETSESKRGQQGYSVFGDIAMLPIKSHEILIDQPYGSRICNINPYAVYTFLGTVKSFPDSDVWFDEARAPDVNVMEMGNYDDLMKMDGSVVWGAWEDNWSGKKTTTTTTTSKTKGSKTTTTTNQWVTAVESNRTNKQYHVSEKIDSYVADDKIISTTNIPYMRSRRILIEAEKLKPNTKFNFYFDNINMNDKCDTMTVIKTKMDISLFKKLDLNTLTSDVSNTRRIDGEDIFIINKGAVIQSGATTGIIIQKMYDVSSSTAIFNVVNVKNGTFGNTVTINGSTYDIISSSKTNELITNESGAITFIYRIPAESVGDSLSFRTGERLMTIEEDTTNVDKSNANNTFYAKGTLNTRQATIVSVKNAYVSESYFSESTMRSLANGQQPGVLVDSKTKITYKDPLAQTFIPVVSGGCFLTKVDIFFATKDPSIPVTLSIIEVVNGMPTQTVLPFSEVTLYPYDVNISQNTVAYLDDMGNTKYVKKYDTPTTFEFSVPVYLNEGVEYAIMLKSDSNNYNVWIANMGDKIPDSTRYISEQPYAGVLFKSQNASTWTAEQMQTLMFKSYYAKFDNSRTAFVDFVNKPLAKRALQKGKFVVTKNSNEVKIFVNNNPYIKLGTIQFDREININGLKIVSGKEYIINKSNPSFFTITAESNANNDGFNNETIYINNTIQFDQFTLNNKVLLLPGTNINCFYKTINGKSIDDKTQIPYLKDANYSPVLYTDTIELTKPSMIIDEKNEALKINDQVKKSFELRAGLSSETDTLSPMLDLQRVNSILVSNNINYPNAGDYGGEYFDDLNTTNSSSVASYITQIISFNASNDMFKLLLTESIPECADVDVYYRTNKAGENNISDKKFIKILPNSTINKNSIGTDNFIEVEYNKTKIEAFDAIQIKIVLKSTNSSAVPKIKNMRLIACV